MRILGVDREWPKLKQPRFTTFRFARKDKDWQVNEVVQVVLKPRSTTGKYLGAARIITKDRRDLIRPMILFAAADSEAKEDGFTNYAAMILWFHQVYGKRIFLECVNKLTLEWA